MKIASEIPYPTASENSFQQREIYTSSETVQSYIQSSVT